MNDIFSEIKKTLSLKASDEVLKGMDRENVRQCRLISLLGFFVETLFLILAFLASDMTSAEDVVGLRSVSLCVAICAVGFIVFNLMARKDICGRGAVTAVTAAFYVLLIVWALTVSYRHYAADQQMLTFFTVQLCFVCFVTFRPLISVILTLASFGSLAFMAYSADGLERLNVYNLAVLAVLAEIGMLVRYFSQVRIQSAYVDFESRNNELARLSRHDILTGQRNRMALAEDSAALYGKTVSFTLCDIDYFKQVNDTYGHAVGDRALKEAGDYISELYPGAAVYRYGGDEFLIVSCRDGEGIHRDPQIETESFEIPVRNSRIRIGLSFGSAGGLVESEQDMLALITEADEKLYEVKRRVHKDD